MNKKKCISIFLVSFFLFAFVFVKIILELHILSLDAQIGSAKISLTMLEQKKYEMLESWLKTEISTAENLKVVKFMGIDISK